MRRINDIDELKDELSNLNNVLKLLDLYKNDEDNIEIAKVLGEDATSILDALMDCNLDKIIDNKCHECNDDSDSTIRDLKDEINDMCNWCDPVNDLEETVHKLKTKLGERDAYIKKLNPDTKYLKKEMRQALNTESKCDTCETKYKYEDLCK